MLKNLTFTAAAVLIGMALPVSSGIAAEPPAHAVVLIDVSDSVPWLGSDEVAARVATDVVRYFPPLGDNARVTVMLFGEYDARRATISEIPVSARFRPEFVKQSVAETIRSIPKLVRDGKLKPHKATNIVGTLLDAAGRVDCKAQKVVVIAATDGQESSADFGTMPPKQQRPVFAGCPELHFVGVNGASPKHTQALEDAWSRWAQLAGFASFTAMH